jgi:antibiotic biosynthesis monooxygenase (ABM) superfamily enzyme
MSKPPKKWKMAILIWIAIYPTVTLTAMLFGEHFQKIKPLPLQTLVSTLIVVPIAVFAVVPAMQKVLSSWLSK